MLKVKNIKKSYKTGDFKQDALKGVSIDFRENEFVIILLNNLKIKNGMLTEIIV